MLHKDKDGVIKLAEENIRYTRRGTEYLQPVTEGRQWWNDFESKWDDIQIIVFETIEYLPEQLMRFNEIKDLDLPESILNDYVMDGIIGKGLENLQLKQLLADLTEVVLLGGAE